MRWSGVWMAALIVVPPLFAAEKEAPGYYSKGVELYHAGRYSDAVEQFDEAVRRKDRAADAQAYIDRIRKETVERIRNRALTGVNKANWQTPYYFMNTVDNRIRVGVSVQEVFERDSANFRPGSVDALYKLARDLAKADMVRVDIELISEIRQDTVVNPELLAQQTAALFSYLSLVARDQLPKF